MFRSANRSVRARAALLWLALLVAASQAGFVMLQRRVLPDAHDPEYGRRLRTLRQLLADNPGRPLLLVMGSSRVALGLQTSLIEDVRLPDGAQPLVFNFSIPGSGVLRELVWLKRVVHDGIRPDRVLVECWPPLVSRVYGDKESVWLPAASLRWDDLWLVDHYGCEPAQLLNDWLEVRLLPCFGDRALWLERLAPAWLPPEEQPKVKRPPHRMDEYGALETPARPPDEYRRPLVDNDRRFYGEAIRHWQLSATSDRSIRATFRFCRSERIPAALLLMPESTEMLSWYPDERRAEVEAYFKRLANDYQVTLIDTRRWVGDMGFLDSHHLSREGAEQFTQRFGREIVPSLFMAEPVKARAAQTTGHAS